MKYMRAVELAKAACDLADPKELHFRNMREYEFWSGFYSEMAILGRRVKFGEYNLPYSYFDDEDDPEEPKASRAKLKKIDEESQKIWELTKKFFKKCEQKTQKKVYRNKQKS